MSRFALVDLFKLGLSKGTHRVEVTAHFDGEEARTGEAVEYTAGEQKTLSGIWKWKTDPSVTEAVYEKLTFTANGQAHTAAVYLYETGAIEYHADAVCLARYDHTGKQWNNGEGDWEVIDFGPTPQKVSDAFYAQFTANAERPATVYFNLSTLGLEAGTYSITVKAKAEGYAASAESEAVEYVAASV